MTGTMNENQYFNAQDERHTSLKETAQRECIVNFPDFIDPRKKPPEPPQRHPQDIDAYFNNLFTELEDIYREQLNRAPPPGLFEKSDGD